MIQQQIAILACDKSLIISMVVRKPSSHYQAFRDVMFLPPKRSYDCESHDHARAGSRTFVPGAACASGHNYCVGY